MFYVKIEYHILQEKIKNNSLENLTTWSVQIVKIIRALPKYIFLILNINPDNNLEVVGGSAVAELVLDEVFVLIGISVRSNDASVGLVVLVVDSDN